MKAALLIASLCVAAGCANDLPEPYDLDHTRIVAVRATPPGISAGERSELDGLIATEGSVTREASPDGATVVAPMSLAGVVSQANGHWYVTAPDEATLAATRVELGLDPGSPVAVQIGVAYNGMDLVAIKEVILGEARTNPSIDSATIDGALLKDKTELTVDAAAETRFMVDAVDTDNINWLSSCGTMHDFDEPTSAYLTVDTNDDLAGEFALVFRDGKTGVTWRVWPIHAEGTPRPKL